MKILQISSARNFGGGEKHLADLCKGLRERGGHDVFAALRADANWLKRLSFLPEENIFRLSLRNSLDIFSARKIAGIIRREKIEIVHAHLARDYPVAALAVRLSPKAKLVLTRHVLFPLNPLQKFMLANVAKVIAVSSAVEANLQKTFPLKKIVSIPNGIEIEKWSEVNSAQMRASFRSEHNIPSNALLIGTIGELKSLKGQGDFVMAAQLVATDFPESYFVVIGKDNSVDKSFRRKLKRLVKVFGLEERFLWLDWVENTAEALAAMDVFVSASHSESFGLSILEAMASGIGIVATETEGAKELLKNDETGKLVPIEKPVELAQAISELLKNSRIRKELGTGAQTIAKERFSLEKMITETEILYQSLTETRP